MEVPNHSNLLKRQNITEQLREKIRTYTHSARINARNSTNDALRFAIPELTKKDVEGLAARIKRRKHATIEDMYRLSHAFLQSIENINAFVNTPGALQVLVKELTGMDSERQIYASEGLCNLSLGEAHVCEKISTASGSYLVTFLDSSEERLKRTVLWTLANIFATSNKSAETLLKMEVLRKLWMLYVADSGEYCEDSSICLQILTSKTKLGNDDLQYILDNIKLIDPKASTNEYHLQIVFNCNLLQCKNIDKETEIYLMNFCLHNLHVVNDLATTKDRLRLIYAIRVLANLLQVDPSCTYSILNRQLEQTFQCNIVKIFNKLLALDPRDVVTESLWLLKNLLITMCNNDINNLLENLRLPKETFYNLKNV